MKSEKCQKRTNGIDFPVNRAQRREKSKWCNMPALHSYGLCSHHLNFPLRLHMHGDKDLLPSKKGS